MEQDNLSQAGAENAPEPAAEAPVETNQEPAVETPAEAAPQTEPAPQEAAAAPAEAPKPAAPVKRKPPVRKPGPTGFDTHMNALLSELYAQYDLEQIEGGPLGSKTIDVWALPAELKGSPKPAGKDKNPWPPRTPIAEKPRDYRLYVHFSAVKDPSWAVPGKDVQDLCKNRSSGLVLLMADQKGYFLPSHKVADLCELFTPVAGAPFKISGPKLRKAAIARFFSLAGFVRELADVLRK